MRRFISTQFKKSTTSLYAMIILLAFSCTSDFEQREVLFYNDSEKINEYSAESIKTLFSNFGFSSIAKEVKYDIVVYKFYYNTTYNGRDIVASGLISLPITDDGIPIVSFQHGTIVAHDDAPSVGWDDYITLTYMSAAGYIMIMPDYIGFGSSDDVIHPYYVADYYGSSIIDMIKAAEEFAFIEGARFNGELFLAGYSEGGYATMAAHKAIEENPIQGMELIASAPASGGYDVKSFQEYFFGLETYNQPFFMGFVAASYDANYFSSSSLSDYFNDPYASVISEAYDGSKNGGDINSLLTTNVAELLKADLIENIDISSEYAEFVDAMNINSLVDWVPEAQMFMYHGTSDITVPYQNSVTTFEKLIAAGASEEKLKFINLEGKNHNSGAIPYFIDVVQKFNDLK